MSLFVLQDLVWRNTRVYGRERSEIVDLIKFYFDRDGEPDPRDYDIFQKVPEPEDIEEVDSGVIYYSEGALLIREEDEEVHRMLEVLPDFQVGVNDEAMLFFADYRRNMEERRRDKLFKVQSRGGLYFVPEDVAMAIKDFDLTDHIDHAIASIRRVRDIWASNPNALPSPAYDRHLKRN